jgi:hypothetical protein
VQILAESRKNVAELLQASATGHRGDGDRNCAQGACGARFVLMDPLEQVPRSHDREQQRARPQRREGRDRRDRHRG